MAGKKGKITGRVTLGVLKQVWGEVDTKDWLQVVRAACPETHWTFSRRTIKGKCPFHDDNDPSFIIDLDQRQAKCWGGDCGRYYYDPIRFFMDMRNLSGANLSYDQALAEMKNRFTLRSLPQRYVSEVKALYKHREMKRLLFEIMRGELIDVVAMQKMPLPDPELYYARDAHTYLIRRGITDFYHYLPLGVFPPKLRLEKLIKNRVQLMSKDEASVFKDVWSVIEEYLEAPWHDTAWIGSLVFFTGSSPSDVCKLKLRKVPPRLASDYVQQNFDKDICYIADDKEQHNGVFGLFGVPPYIHRIGKDHQDSFYWVEGEFDALCTWVKQFSNEGDIRTLVFSGGGGSTCGLDVMKHHRFTNGFIVADYDAGGLKFIKQILETTVDIRPRIFEWPEKFLKTPKGVPVETVDPADILSWYGLDSWQTELRSPDNYTPPHLWALERATHEMNGIEETDIRHLTNVAANWGRYVRNDAEQHAFVTELGKRFGIAAAQIIAEIKTGDENEDAFIERIRLYLTARLQPMHALRAGQTHFLRVWDTVTQEIYELALEDRNRIKSTMAAMLGKDILKFVQDDVGEPSFLAVDDEQGVPTYIARTNKCADYISYAVTRLAATVPIDAVIRKVGAGLHCLAPSLDQPDEKFRLYLVNGTSLYRGDFDDLEELTWTKLPGPCDGPVVVYAEGSIRPRKFMPHIHSDADLNQRPAMRLPELYDTIYNMLHKGWEFKNHDITCEMLAAAIMVIPIANCVPRQMLLHFSSEAVGGKSSLIGGLIGRNNLSSINIIQAAVYSDNYTVAGVRQAMNYSSLAVCLDEFEDKGYSDRHSHAFKGCLHLFRGHSNEEGRTIIGSTSGAHQEFSLHCPAFIAGIRGLDDLADISRFIHVEMDRKAFRSSPDAVLLELFGEEMIQKVRHHLPLALFRKALAFRTAYFRITEEFRGGGNLEFGKLTRSLSHFFPVMAMLHICGRDYQTFIKRYFSQYRSNFERLTTTSTNSDLLNEILHTPSVRIPSVDDPRPRTVNEILSGDQPEMLNLAYCGVYYDSVQRWLVVHWPRAIIDFIRGREFKERSPHYLRQLATRSPYAVGEKRVLQDKILDRLRPYIGAAVTPGTLSVFDLKSLLKDAEQTPRIKGRETVDVFSKYQAALERLPVPKQAACAPLRDTSHEQTEEKCGISMRTLNINIVDLLKEAMPTEKKNPDDEDLTDDF